MKTVNLKDIRWKSVVVNIDCQIDRVDIYVEYNLLNMPVRYLSDCDEKTYTNNGYNHSVN